MTGRQSVSPQPADNAPAEGADLPLVAQILRYLVVGGLAFLVDYGSLALLTSGLGWYYLESAAVAYVLGTIVNYALSVRFVFKVRTVKSAGVEFMLFALIGLAGLAFNQLFLWALTDGVGLHYLQSKLVTTALVLIWNFTARKLLLFTSLGSRAKPSETPPPKATERAERSLSWKESRHNGVPSGLRPAEVPLFRHHRFSAAARGDGSEMKSDSQRYAVIIGAGPAGLTAAYELLTRTDVLPIVLEKSTYMGGISRTVNYKGNRIDIGGHRFFSKSDRVMNWWLQFMPIADQAEAHEITYQRATRQVAATPPANSGVKGDVDRVMLVRNRKSRIYFLRRFFTYPITLSKDTVLKLGLWRTFRIGLSYLYSVVRPIRQEKNLEEFFINRFGRVLYRTFFKSYTEKVWGVPCHEISAEWGAQRIKGLSILKSLKHAASKIFRRRSADLSQKSTETSLIERFLYPKFGPGQMWETVAAEVVARGGRIVTGARVERLYLEGDRVTHVETRDATSGQTTLFCGDFFFSTMPIKELIASLDSPVPANVREVAAGLLYRDFITVGLLVDRLLVSSDSPQGKKLIEDNWIYVQEPDVQVGRLQIFNNWSPAMVADPSKVWIGMEYFCYDTDPIWKQSDEDMTRLAIGELAKIGIIRAEDVRDSTVIRMPKTYPAYFGAYERFAEIRQYVDSLENLFLVGRNGMHKYNNQDHSMLTAMVAVDNIAAGVLDKANLWDVNTEQEYHEESQDKVAGAPAADTQLAKAS